MEWNSLILRLGLSLNVMCLATQIADLIRCLSLNYTVRFGGAKDRAVKY